MISLENEVRELIKRRRNQVLIHSIIYYRYGTSVIDDKKFDEWAYQLAALQLQYPEISEQCPYAQEFKGFDGTTGYHLPMYDSGLLSKALYIIQISQQFNKEQPGGHAG
ncbi:DNA ligase LigA-related protein [Paenibacillus xylanexedens]|uniref:DNA ligase LigA-related protein n=1 Tax=Paenibacillus xylanexedens TaxID=528191 RepID=UPI000F52A10D|nr:hypothetical protein [Paenibacillus xylanexedens]RPK19969.1 hypothetical protein EDO6_06486 [Paenibacillus xylanexedens]